MNVFHPPPQPEDVIQMLNPLQSAGGIKIFDVMVRR